MITLINATVTWESQESVLFQPVLKAYPSCHSWIITAHISLGNLEKQWRMFFRQIERNTITTEFYTTNTTSRAYQFR